MQASAVKYVKPEFQKAVSIWLLGCLLLIALMIALGGYTRLSGSGLSITEWKPIYGSIPPLNASEWQEEFGKYQAIPQYQQLNLGMSLDEFKDIYWPEYWHRNLGRLIGLVYALPMFFYMLRRAFIGWFNARLMVVLALGGLQGLIGWIMVASGLQERIYVHHIKLALHFGTAMLLTAAIFWTWLDVRHNRPSQHLADRSMLYIALFIFWQLILGGLVAGLHAGLIYNTFPLMNGDLVASDVFKYAGSWFDHVPMVQFVHRWAAKLIVILIVVWWIASRNKLCEAAVKRAAALLFAMLAIQFILGVLTLINAVPLTYALLHQFGGVALLLAALNLAHKLKTARK